MTTVVLASTLSIELSTEASCLAYISVSSGNLSSCHSSNTLKRGDIAGMTRSKQAGWRDEEKNWWLAEGGIFKLYF